MLTSQEEPMKELFARQAQLHTVDFPLVEDPQHVRYKEDQ